MRGLDTNGLTFTVQLTADKTKEPNETLSVVATSSLALVGTAGTITILDDDSPLTATSLGRTINAASTAPTAIKLTSALGAGPRGPTPVTGHRCGRW